jgi:uncharacterized protein with GYD domain
MPLYIRLVKLTEQGARNIRGLDKMRAAARDIIEKNGGRLVAAYVTLGRYDLIAIVEAPDNKAMARISGLIAAEGNFQAETLPAIPIEEFEKSIKA